VEWAILSGVRIGKEATLAKWGEIDWKRRVWTVPASRMKMEDDKRGEAHEVPISPGMARLLRQVRPCRRPSPKAYIFPNSQTAKAYSHTAVWMVVKRINTTVTTHGFRTSLVGWGSAIAHGVHGPFDRELMETCIAHRIGGQTSAAYLRDRWLARRRIVMKAWSKWCFAAPNANVVPIRRAA
jgi:integrase